MPDFESERTRMIEEQLRGRGISDARVLQAFARVPRHTFVPEIVRSESYTDRALSIHCGQSISQPYMVATMLQVLHLRGHEKVLEVGTGTGYQTAILAELAAQIYTQERHRELLVGAKRRLDELGYSNVQFVLGDGALGMPSVAPFDAIVVAAAAPNPPEALVAQLADGGKLVVPVGSPTEQRLVAIIRHGEHTERREFGSCVFVPLVSPVAFPENS
jgi:protein-L-isoaspartate(D-aspartate) O-methyltransferase